MKRDEKIEAPKTSHDHDHSTHDHSAHDHSGHHDHSDHNHGPAIDKPELLKSDKHETTGSHTQSHESGKEHVIKATSHASAKTTTWLPAILLAAFLVVFIVSRV